MKRLISEAFPGFVLRVKGRENIREYIMEMSNLAEKLKSLKLELGENLIVHLVLISLPTLWRKRGYRELRLEVLIFLRPLRMRKGKTLSYLYLIHEKSQSLDVFKSFKAEVELQLGKKIKAIKSDRGGGYYSRYDGSGEQCPGPFALFLREYKIVSQYTMRDKPSMNDVAKQRNKTLEDMGKALKITIYILNRVPTKVVNKTPYELWTGKKPSIKHMHIWGCPAKA
ncbi:hypothetical protein CR513_50637, partial [Mucuna pruriens]